jgi:hypothetical protein
MDNLSPGGNLRKIRGCHPAIDALLWATLEHLTQLHED